jgi:hypothetical protein
MGEHEDWLPFGAMIHRCLQNRVFSLALLTQGDYSATSVNTVPRDDKDLMKESSK